MQLQKRKKVKKVFKQVERDAQDGVFYLVDLRDCGDGVVWLWS